MALPREITVSTLKGFTEQVEKSLARSRALNPLAKFKGNWYRGHGRARAFKLVPALYRHPKTKKLRDLLILEKQMLDDFRRQSVLHQEFRTTKEENARFETLCYMQHYGVPTRLLDWTVNPFIALYFALTDSPTISGFKGSKEHAAVWILDPTAWNSKALGDLDWKDRGPALPEDKELKSYYPRIQYEPEDIKQIYELPVATLGVSNNIRMFAQKGVFMMFGRSSNSMELIYEKVRFPRDCLKKLVIEKSNIEKLLDNLLSIGFTDSVSYPDLHGLALELKRHNGFRT